MTQTRVKGYVVGYDIIGKKLLWSVKVKDQNSAHNGVKFIVASCGQNTLLCENAVDVTFKIEPRQGGEETILRATDVRFLHDVRDGHLQKPAPTKEAAMNIVVSEMGGEVFPWLTGCTSREETEDGMATGEKIIAFLSFDIEDYTTDDDIIALFDAIKAITYTTPGAEALELLLGAVYALKKE